MKRAIKAENIRETGTHVIYEFSMVPHTIQEGKKVVTKKEIFSYLRGLGHKITLGTEQRYKNSYNQRLKYEVSFEKVKRSTSSPKKSTVAKKAPTPKSVVPKVP